MGKEEKCVFIKHEYLKPGIKIYAINSELLVTFIATSSSVGIPTKIVQPEHDIENEGTDIWLYNNDGPVCN